jgi:transcriptional antiterminator RfaH
VWFVVRTKPNQDARAKDNVERQGAEFYSPRAMIRSEKSRVLRPAPLFPGYAFVRHPDQHWVFLRSTFGILDILMVAEDKPATLPPTQIDRLKVREGPDGLVRLEAREFKVGERVHVDRGSLSLDAVVDGMASQDRIYVLMGVLGGARVEVDVKDVTRE